MICKNCWKKKDSMAYCKMCFTRVCFNDKNADDEPFAVPDTVTRIKKVAGIEVTFDAKHKIVSF